VTIRWSLMPDVPEPLPVDAIAPLLALTHATTIHDAHEHAVDAVKAGATSEQVRQAIKGWLSLQSTQVQTVQSAPVRCRCSHGAVNAHRRPRACWQTPCACDRYRDKEDQ
jgi:hypothetical protein